MYEAVISSGAKALASVAEMPSVLESRRVYIETYGCQMNVSDSELVASILQEAGCTLSFDVQEADIILLNSCAIRDKAEQSIRKRLANLVPLKARQPDLQIGLLGCMAERLKNKLLEEEQLVDVVVGPDAYRSLPALLAQSLQGQRAVNTLLSREETYADIRPVRLHKGGVSAFISIMRGCDNMCAFCVVPMTRGRERSRDPHSIVAEARTLFDEGYREVTLLGQNVDSYVWTPSQVSKGRQKHIPLSQKIEFASLLERVAAISPDLRIRFSTSHPRDMTNEVLHAMARHENICKSIHLPVQSGSDRVLDRMKRGYDKAMYMARVYAIKKILGENCGISTDIITGFAGERSEDHKATLDLMNEVHYDQAFMFMYSERPQTYAARHYADDVPVELKKERLEEIISKQREHALLRNQAQLGSVHTLLIEGPSKRSADELQGRNSASKVIVFPKKHPNIQTPCQVGQYLKVHVESCTPATLRGYPVAQ